MGQQQILIMVLTIVIVGLAIYVGVDLWNRSVQQRHVDLLVNHTVMVASEAVAWRSKETPFIGGGGSYEELNVEGMRSMQMAEERLPGTVRIISASVNEVVIVAVSSDFPQLGVRTRVEGTEIVETVIARDGTITLPDGEEVVEI